MSDVSGEFCGWWKARGASVRAFYGVACAGGELLEVEQAATCGEEEDGHGTQEVCLLL